MKELIKQHCNKLKLGSRIYENYENIKADSNEEFLEKLLAMEVEARTVNRKNRYVKTAGFDVIKTFENYTFEHVEIPSSIGINDIKQAAFLLHSLGIVKGADVGQSAVIQADQENRGKLQSLRGVKRQ